METTTSVLNFESENISKVIARLFKVQDQQIKKETILKNSPLGFFTCATEDVKIPKTKVIYSSNGYELGQVGKDYQSIQPINFLESILKSINACGLDFLNPDTLAYNSWSDDKRIEFRFDLPTVWIKLPNGKGDAIDRKLTFQTGFGGRQRSFIGVWTFRQVCSNGMKLWSADLLKVAKHTAKMNLVALDYCNDIVEVIDSSNRTVNHWEKMSETMVTNKEIEIFVDKVFEIKDRAEMSGKMKAIVEKVNEAIGLEINIAGSNVWALLNGITRYTNHLATNHSEEYVVVGTGSATNDKAQQLALAMIQA